MSWLVLWAIALIILFIRRRISFADEVYALSIYMMSLFSFLWGFAIAPIPAQVTLEVLTLGWIKTQVFRNR